MSSSITTSVMVVPPENILSLLTPGAIKAMVAGDPTHEVSSSSSSSSSRLKKNASSEPSKPLYTVLTYPCKVMSVTRPDDLFVSVSNDFYIYDGKHHLRVQILDNESLDDVFADFGPTAKTTCRDHMTTNCVLINIQSYVTSLANTNQDEPILCLTSIEICEHDLIEPRAITSHSLYQNNIPISHVCLIPPGTPFITERGSIMGGTIVDFLSNIAPFMSFEALSGCQEIIPATRIPFNIGVVTSNHEHKQKMMKMQIVGAGGGNYRDRVDVNYDETTKKLETIALFLARYQAMNTLIAVSKKESNDALARLPSSIALEMSVIESFRNYQLERHKASITANRARTEPTSTTTTIMEQHQDVLQDIYEHKIPIINQSTDVHIDMLHYCHSKLCQNLISESGTFRMKTVRVSTTNYVFNGNMHNVVSRMLLSLHNLRTRLVYLNYETVSTVNHSSASPSNGTRLSTAPSSFFGNSTNNVSNQAGRQRTNDRTIEQRRVLATLTYAAAVCMGVLDTHPYLDGNGRLARILLNFVLHHQLQLPFSIPLFATPEQRMEYTKAICKTRQNIALLPVGNVRDDLLIEAYENCGALQPMVELILDCIYKSVTECNKRIAEKVGVHTEELDSRTARDVRERVLTTSSCLVCYESPPNMSTLCCGTAFHVKCLAQWLKTNGTCPQCRFEIPRIEETTLSRDLRRIVNYFSDIIPSDFHEYADDTLHDGLLSILEEHAGYAQNNDNNERNDDEDNTEEIGSQNDTDEHDTDHDDTNDTVVPTDLPPECRYCNNLSARGCSNSLCARCCRVNGGYCTRHGT